MFELWQSRVISGYVAQLRFAQRPAWTSADDAMGDALQGRIDADRLRAAFRAMQLANESLAGRFDLNQAPADIRSLFIRDDDNGVTRFCVATMELSRSQARGANLSTQLDRFATSMDGVKPARATFYRREWWAGWTDALKRHGLESPVAMKPNIQAVFGTPLPTIIAPVGALPLATDAGLGLARGLESSGRSSDGQRVRRLIRSVLRRAPQGDGSIANTMLCADLLVRTAIDDPSVSAGDRTRLVAWRDELRREIAAKAPRLTDQADLTRGPVWASAEWTYRWLVATTGRAIAALCVLGGVFCSWLALTLGVIRARPEVDAPERAGAKGAKSRRIAFVTLFALAFILSFGLAGVPLARGMPTWGPWWMAVSAACFISGAMLPIVISRESGVQHTKRWIVGVAVLSGCLAVPFLPPIELVYLERFVRGHALVATVAMLVTVGAAGLAWSRRKPPKAGSSTAKLDRHLRVTIAMTVCAVITAVMSLRVRAVEADVGNRPFDAAGDELVSFLGSQRAETVLEELATFLEKSAASQTTSAPDTKL